MRVNIDEIKEGGLRRSWEVTREALDAMVAGDRVGFRARAPVHVETALEKIDRRVLVEAHAKVQLTAACGRCLGPTDLDLPVDFELTLVPSDEYEVGPKGARGSDRARVAGSFEPVEADEEVYTGKVIDLDPILREQVLLALPGYPICREGCKGLCPVCGANLNERECGCDRRVPDPRWDGLKNVKL